MAELCHDARQVKRSGSLFQLEQLQGHIDRRKDQEGKIHKAKDNAEGAYSQLKTKPGQEQVNDRDQRHDEAVKKSTAKSKKGQFHIITL